MLTNSGSRFARSRVEHERIMQKHVESAGKKQSYIAGETWVPLKEDKYEITIMPYLVTKSNHPDLQNVDYVPGQEYWYRRGYSVHWHEKKPYVCPKDTMNQKCPFCEEREKYEYNSEEEKSLRPRRMMLYAIKVKGETGYKIFDFGYSKFAKQLEEELDMTEDRSNLAFYEFVGGKNIAVTFKMNTDSPKMKYLEAKRFVFTDRKDLDESVIDEVPKLDDCITILSYDKLKSILVGSVDSIINEDTPEPSKPVEKPVPAKVETAKASDDDWGSTETVAKAEAPKVEVAKKAVSKKPVEKLPDLPIPTEETFEVENADVPEPDGEEDWG